MGDERPADGFCPAEFYVPDISGVIFRDYYDPENDSEQTQYFLGNYAFYSGCLWGDDTDWKLRYIDLSRISEGIVVADDRYGYVPLMHDLKKSIEVEEDGLVTFAVKSHFYVDDKHVCNRGFVTS